MSFRTIRTDINGPFLLTLKAILQPPHTTEEVRCGAGGHPKSGHHQDRDELRITSTSIMKHGFDAVSFRTIRTDFNGPFLHSKGYIAAATHD